MSWRTVIISNRAKLDLKMGYLVVRGDETQRVLLDEIAILIIENPAVSLTGCLIEALAEKKVKTVFCNSKRNPSSELVPYYGCFDSSAKIRTQIRWPDDIKALIWREIIAEKIRKQSEFLSELGKQKEAELLNSYVPEIEPADSTNREGHAAKVYFNALFGMDFTRSMDGAVNSALNYGYSIVLSMFNREIAANGYLTQLGIFHNNMFNYFNLSCDLMEPFRILVDRTVYAMMPEDFAKEEKISLWHINDESLYIDGCRQTLLNSVKLYTRSVFEAINDCDISKIRFYEFPDKKMKSSFQYE